jgi:hypothetical protein
MPLPYAVSPLGIDPGTAPAVPLNDTNDTTSPAVVTLKAVPNSCAPPPPVTPYKVPSPPSTKPASGDAPFTPEKEKTVVIIPSGITRKTVPIPCAPPLTVVPYHAPSAPLTKRPIGCSAPRTNSARSSKLAALQAHTIPKKRRLMLRKNRIMTKLDKSENYNLKIYFRKNTDYK